MHIQAQCDALGGSAPHVISVIDVPAASSLQARQLTPKGLSMLMWSVGNMEVPPPKAWVAKLLVATQVGMRARAHTPTELSRVAHLNPLAAMSHLVVMFLTGLYCMWCSTSHLVIRVCYDAVI